MEKITSKHVQLCIWAWSVQVAWPSIYWSPIWLQNLLSCFLLLNVYATAGLEYEMEELLLWIYTIFFILENIQSFCDIIQPPLTYCTICMPNQVTILDGYYMPQIQLMISQQRQLIFVHIQVNKRIAETSETIWPETACVHYAPRAVPLQDHVFWVVWNCSHTPEAYWLLTREGP